MTIENKLKERNIYVRLRLQFGLVIKTKDSKDGIAGAQVGTKRTQDF